MQSPCSTRRIVKTVRSGALASSVVGIASSDQAHENAEPPVDMRAQKSDHKTCDRHAHGAGIDREAHRGRGHVVVPRQGRQDRLRGEQVDHGEKRRQADDEGSQHHAGRVTVHVHRVRFSSARIVRSWRILPVSDRERGM